MDGEDITKVAELDRENVSGWAILHFEQLLANPCSFHFVIRHAANHRLCGFICGQLVGPEAEIHKIAVAQNSRRHGIGTALLHHTLQFLQKKKAESCFLELRATNSPAMGLYNAFHFERVTRRKNYYTSPPEDAIIMKLYLPQTDKKTKPAPTLR